jgi:hypothetical protein
MLNAAEGVTDGDEMNPIVVREGAQRTTRTDEVMLFHCCLLLGYLTRGQLRRDVAIMPNYSTVTTFRTAGMAGRCHLLGIIPYST